MGAVPVDVACLVPSAPLLLPRLTGDRVAAETATVRAAVATALRALAGPDRLVVVAPDVPGTLDGFGGRAAPAAPRDVPPPGSWPWALAAELLAGVPGLAPVGAWEHEARDVDLVALAASPLRTGLLLLGDGSRTRGPRAPGGDDPRGLRVDDELAAALRGQRAADVPDAAAVGATAGPAVDLLARLAQDEAARGGSARTEVLLAEAPAGVGYLVAIQRRAAP